MSAELAVRAGVADAALIRRIFGLDGSVAAPYRPSRLVTDAHVAAASGLSGTAREAGVPFLVDPLTHYLQDGQYPEHPWTRLPFARAAAVTPGDLANSRRRARLAEAIIQFQLDHGATRIVAPYLHVDRPGSAWVETQAQWWRTTRAVLDARGETLPVIAVVAVGWRCLDRRAVADLVPLWDALRDLGPAEVALAASKVHDGVRPDERLADLLVLTKDLGASYPLLMWQQGLLGEVCVAAGAVGYECGIGWRERCDLTQALSSQRRPPEPGRRFGPRPVYLADLGRSVPKATITSVHEHPALWRTIVCAEPHCCPPAGDALLGDARRHAVVARAQELSVLDAAVGPGWAWGRLADKAAMGLDLAARINRVAASRVDTRVLSAVKLLATARRQTVLSGIRRTA